MKLGSQSEVHSATRRFEAAIADALRLTAASHNSLPWESHVSHPAGGAPSAMATNRVTVSMRLRGGLNGEIFLSIDEQGAAGLLANAEPLQPDQLPQAWLRWVSASLAHIPQALAPLFGSVAIEDCRLAGAQAGLIPVVMVDLHGGEGVNAAVHLHAGSELQTSLEQHASFETSLVASAPRLTSAESKASLHRVIDVPLAVTLRFGQRQLTLRELLALNTGSLVELDRQVEEPVDLMLGERVVARGEVVIVDGNYGMRVTEVVERPAQRLSSGNTALLKTASIRSTVIS